MRLGLFSCCALLLMCGSLCSSLSNRARAQSDDEIETLADEAASNRAFQQSDARRAHETPAPIASNPPVSADALAAALERYDQEPTVREVVAAALRAAVNPKRLTSMAQRARLRGLIPSLEVGARRGQGFDLRSTATDLDSANLATADDLVLEATLRFDLSRLLFAPEEVGISRELRWNRRERAEVVRDVVQLYFLRKRLLLERDLHGRNDVDHAVRIAETEALLDVFTNGAFQRMMLARSAWTIGARTRASVPPSRPK